MKIFLLLPLLLLAFIANGQILDTNFPQAKQGVNVAALVASGDTLYVGGDFSLLGGKTRYGLGAIDIVTGEVLDFAPIVTGSVNGMILLEGKLLLWGNFSHINGVTRNNLAIVDAVTGVLDPFSLAIGFPGIPGMQTGNISDMQVVGDTLFLAGYFFSVNGQPRSNLAAVTLDGTLLSWNPGSSIPVNRILVRGDHVYVAGPFFNPRQGLMAFHRHTGALLPWNPQPNNPGNTFGPMIQLEGSTDILVSGPFSTFGSIIRPYLARVDGLSGQPGSFNAGVMFSTPVTVMINTLVQMDSLIYAGGNFQTTFGGVYRQNLLVMDPNSGALSAWNPAPNGRVHTILHHQGAIFVGGEFNQISGESRSLLASYNTNATSSTDQAAGDSPMLLYPNPSQGLVTLDSSHPLQWVHLTHINGQVLQQWTQLPEGQTQLDIQAYPAGRYYLECRSKQGDYTLPLELIRR